MTEQLPEDDIVARTIHAKNTYIKHLCTCNCILPQFVDAEKPQFHQFVVFSLLNKEAEIVPGMVKCNYCGKISRVTGIGTLEPIRSETSAAIETIEEIQDQLPGDLLKKMGVYVENTDFPTWQEIRHVYENETCWGVIPIVLHSETDAKSGTSVAKVLNIMGKTIYNVRTVTID